MEKKGRTMQTEKKEEKREAGNKGLPGEDKQEMDANDGCCLLCFVLVWSL